MIIQTAGQSDKAVSTLLGGIMQTSLIAEAGVLRLTFSIG